MTTNGYATSCFSTKAKSELNSGIDISYMISDMKKENPGLSIGRALTSISTVVGPILALVVLWSSLANATPISCAQLLTRSMGTLRERISLFAKRLSSSPEVGELHAVSAELAKDPSNEVLRGQFFELANKVSYHYENFKEVGKAYDRVLAVNQKDKLSFAHLEMLVRFLQSSHKGLRHYPDDSSPATKGVQNYFADRIVRELGVNPTFTAHDALILVQQLKAEDVHFTPFPRSYWGRWILGEILRAASTAGKDTSKVEEAIIVSVSTDSASLSRRLLILAGIQNNVRTYRITDRILKTVKGDFAAWIGDKTNYPAIESEIERTNTNPHINVSFLSQHAKRVMSFREFLLEVNETTPSGILLGDSRSEGIYYAVADFARLTSFISAYHRAFMTVKMEHLPKEQQLEKSRKFMGRLLSMGKDIIFLLPSDLSEMFYTKDEFEFLIADPRRLAKVTFVLGAYSQENKQN